MGGRRDIATEPTPEGSARHGNTQMLPVRLAGTAAGNASVNRASNQLLWIGTTDSWGQAGSDQGTMILYKGASMYRCRGGCVMHTYRFPVVSDLPTALSGWRDMLFVFEIVLAWPTNTTGVENGITACYTENPVNQQVISSTNPGWVLYNDNGTLKFGMRPTQGGAIATTTIVPAITVTELTKFRFEWRSAKKNGSASLVVYMNDLDIPIISKTSADASWPPPQGTTNSVINFGPGIRSGTEYLNYRDVAAWCGPDTTIGM